MQVECIGRGMRIFHDSLAVLHMACPMDLVGSQAILVVTVIFVVQCLALNRHVGLSIVVGEQHLVSSGLMVQAGSGAHFK